MQYELAMVPLLQPLAAYALRTSWVDVVLISDKLDLDDHARHAIAKELIAHLDQTGKLKAHRAHG